MFGELVMFMPVEDKSRRKKLEERFRTGMYVGLVDRSDEVGSSHVGWFLQGACH